MSELCLLLPFPSPPLVPLPLFPLPLFSSPSILMYIMGCNEGGTVIGAWHGSTSAFSHSLLLPLCVMPPCGMCVRVCMFFLPYHMASDSPRVSSSLPGYSYASITYNKLIYILLQARTRTATNLNSRKVCMPSHPPEAPIGLCRNVHTRISPFLAC